jgi:succinate-semialdehyde dehydrogenase / glutarate-semialdehyde dehydrogenase
MSQILKIRNPRTGAHDYELASTAPEELMGIATRLRSHSHDWEAAGAAARARVLAKWKDALLAERENLIDALIVDTGRKRESIMEFDSAVGNIARWAERAPVLLAEAPSRDSIVKPMKLTAASTPLGLIAVISPWNFPMLLALIDAVPALAAGCTVMLKPSEVTPRFIEPLRRTIASVPELANVLHIVAGGAATGAAMIDVADAVCFTGSVATGRVIARHCAERLIPAFLELGGKDAAIVLDGVDIARTARAIAWGGLANAGQSCLSIERVLVEAPIFKSFSEALAAEANALELAYPSLDDGLIGPLIAERQAETISSQLEDAFAQGATALSGGKIESFGGGLWCKPTVLINVTTNMKIMTDETFGPVLPVMACRDRKHALEIANSTEFGLSGAVFGPLDAADAVARQMDCGAVSINDAALTAIVHDGEKQAFKHSGLGASRMGDSSIARFRRRRILIENPTLSNDPWWFQARP